MSLSFEAMVFAREAHAGQVRKYSGNPYFDHVAEVAGIVSTVMSERYNVHLFPGTQPTGVILATAFLHDSVEDCPHVSLDQIASKFGPEVAKGVYFLSDLETFGNRTTRKAASRERLSRAPAWVQTIKCADLISNTAGIVASDPQFAVTYLAEKRLLLDVLTLADRRLWTIARELAEAA